jgi:hypothetical protein
MMKNSDDESVDDYDSRGGDDEVPSSLAGLVSHIYFVSV